MRRIPVKYVMAHEGDSLSHERHAPRPGRIRERVSPSPPPQDNEVSAEETEGLRRELGKAGEAEGDQAHEIRGLRGQIQELEVERTRGRVILEATRRGTVELEGKAEDLGEELEEVLANPPPPPPAPPHPPLSTRCHPGPHHHRPTSFGTRGHHYHRRSQSHLLLAQQPTSPHANVRGGTPPPPFRRRQIGR